MGPSRASPTSSGCVRGPSVLLRIAEHRARLEAQDISNVTCARMPRPRNRIEAGTSLLIAMAAARVLERVRLLFRVVGDCRSAVRRLGARMTQFSFFFDRSQAYV